MADTVIHWENHFVNGENRGETAAIMKRAYFLWRCRFNNLRCLCLRIFLRRFLITLPNGFLRCSVELGSFSERA